MMNHQIKNIITTILCLGHIWMYSQQDAMFTRYMYTTNMHYNPAAADRYEGLRASMAYRRQWAGLVGAPTTLAVGIETSLSDRKAGVGINLFSDRIGFDQHNGIQTNYAYRIPIQKEWSISLGFKGGVSFVSSDFTTAITPQPGTMDPVHTNPYNRTVARAGTGFLLTNDRTYIGFSIPNVLSLLQSEFLIKDNDAYLSRHLYTTVGHIFGDEEDDIQYKPSVFVKYQAAAPIQVDLSMQAWYKNRMAFGLSYRTGDAISGIIDVALRPDVTLSYAYDYTISGFRQIGTGAHEVSFLYTWLPESVKVPSIHKFLSMPKI